MNTITVTEARAQLPALVDEIARGGEVTITRHGVPVAVLVGPDRLRRRRVSDTDAVVANLAADLEQAGARPLDRSPTITSERADAMVADLRDERDSG
jgi:prevent-host-death family protein